MRKERPLTPSTLKRQQSDVEGGLSGTLAQTLCSTADNPFAPACGAARQRRKMIRLMFVTPRMHVPPSGGRAMLSALHHDCLRDLLGERLLVEELDSVPANGARAAGERLL